jgi:hypothetical protein
LVGAHLFTDAATHTVFVVQRIWFVVYYFVYIMRTVVVAGIAVLAQFLVPIIAQIPATAGTVKVSVAEILIFFNFEGHL